MRVELISRTSSLEAIADQWNELVLPSPMQSPEWLIPWWQIYGRANRELAVLAVRGDAGDLLGLCPWYVEARPMGRCLRWLGDGAVCSDHAGILCAPGAAQEVVRAAIGWLNEFRADLCTRIELEAVDADDKVLAGLTATLHRCGWLVTQREEPGCAWIELPPNRDEYLATVSKNQRKRCRRWQREFFDTGRARVEVVTAPAECLQAFEQLVLLHNQRRHATGSRGAFEDADFRGFHQLAIHRLARRGRLELRLLTIDHQLAAIEYSLVDAAAVYAYQSGLSAAGQAVSAGNLSMLSLIQDAIDRGRRRVDLLRGTESYKFSWGAVHRPAQTKTLRRRSVAGLLQSCLDNARERARSWKKTYPARLAKKRTAAAYF